METKASKREKVEFILPELTCIWMVSWECVCLQFYKKNSIRIVNQSFEVMMYMVSPHPHISLSFRRNKSRFKSNCFISFWWSERPRIQWIYIYLHECQFFHDLLLPLTLCPYIAKNERDRNKIFFSEKKNAIVTSAQCIFRQILSTVLFLCCARKRCELFSQFITSMFTFLWSVCTRLFNAQIYALSHLIPPAFFLCFLFSICTDTHQSLRLNIYWKPITQEERYIEYEWILDSIDVTRWRADELLAQFVDNCSQMCQFTVTHMEH